VFRSQAFPALGAIPRLDAMPSGASQSSHGRAPLGAAAAPLAALAAS
jgi:hypothetical protein